MSARSLATVAALLVTAMVTSALGAVWSVTAVADTLADIGSLSSEVDVAP